jgi:hypothetical protein
MAPHPLTRTVPSLPPILHMHYPSSISSYSKGSRGLSVLLRVVGIFTDTTTSLSLWLRQFPDRYAIRAGRNLPDKEFRYLRTVIVTAAVYRGLNSELRSEELTPPRDLPAPGRRQTLYVVFDFAESCVFGKQSPGTFHCNPSQLQSRRPSPTRGTPSPEVTGLICRVP